MNPFHSSHSLYVFHQFFNYLSPRRTEAISAATYFTLQACDTWDNTIGLATIEDAEDAGDFRIHVGFSDQPDIRSVFVCPALSDAVAVLGALRAERPGVPLWLSTAEIHARIEGDDVWPALVAARASCDPTDTDCPWVQLAADFATGQARTSYGDSERKHWLHADIAGQIGSV